MIPYDESGDETAYKFADYKPTGGEYLSGFWKTDKLLPVVTVTVYFGADEWDGPLSLSEMYSMADSNQTALGNIMVAIYTLMKSKLLLSER